VVSNIKYLVAACVSIFLLFVWIIGTESALRREKKRHNKDPRKYPKEDRKGDYILTIIMWVFATICLFYYASTKWGT
jgi:L-asparagine transporter-like permease